MDNLLVQPDAGLYVWTILTFLVLAALLAKYAWRPLLEALERRQAAIAASLDDARKAKDELEQLHAESAKILAETRQEADAILLRTRAETNAFREEMKQKAREESAAIVETAERQIQLETARARQQIRAEAVDLSVDLASKLLQRNLSKADNERLLEDTLKQLEATELLS
jgi:F-type H+-transporting ATPase subunit b